MTFLTSFSSLLISFGNNVLLCPLNPSAKAFMLILRVWRSEPAYFMSPPTADYDRLRISDFRKFMVLTIGKNSCCQHRLCRRKKSCETYLVLIL